MISNKSNLLLANNGPYSKVQGTNNNIYKKNPHGRILEITSNLYKFKSSLKTVIVNGQYKRIKVPDHAFIVNELKTNSSTRLLGSYFFVLKNNKFYPPSWYNISPNGHVCLGLKQRYIKTVEELISFFWQSQFNLDIQRSYYNFSTYHINNVDVNNYIPMVREAQNYTVPEHNN